MSGTLNLEQILPQLQRAYLATLQVADEQEARRLRRYFREDGTPYVQALYVPDPQSAGTWQKIDVPLYALSAASSLRMKELTFEFEGRLEGLGAVELTGPETPGEKKARPRRRKTRSETARLRIVLRSLTPGADGEESGVPAHASQVGVEVTIVYPGETLHGSRILG